MTPLNYLFDSFLVCNIQLTILYYDQNIIWAIARTQKEKQMVRRMNRRFLLGMPQYSSVISIYSFQFLPPIQGYNCVSS